MNIFWGMNIFGGRHKFGLYLGFISMHFRVFSYGQCTEWGIFYGGCQNFKYFWGVLEIPDIFRGDW